MGVIDKINTSQDIKELSWEELDALAIEIRQFLIRHVAETGGHLSSNLGAVELTLAIHRVFDSTSDRIVFDVGHQCYTHKIITGRKDSFSTLRQYGGISGFPKPKESNDDAFIAGHASNAISVALGMAKARTLQGKDYHVVALVGDGALTGGLSYEGLEGAAASDEPMVIILNDNHMSIDPNVGGMASLLQNLRVKPGYLHFKKIYRDVLKPFPELYEFSHAVKEKLKDSILPGNVFSSLGLNYLGPVDGHNIKELTSVLALAKDINGPVIIHAVTRKGKGCFYTENHPDLYHGVGRFDPVTGELASGGKSFSDCFGETLCRIAEKDSRIIGITAAMTKGTGMEQFARCWPERFVDCGIAEGHASSMAGGLAKQGMIPVFAVYSSFLQRGFDMLIHDIALQNLHAVFCVDRAGLVGSDGETHHGIFDLSYLRTVPGMTIFAPANYAELESMLNEAVGSVKGPVAIRYPRGSACSWQGKSTEPETVLETGTDCTLVCYGTMTETVIDAASILKENNITPEIIKLNRLSGSSFPLTMDSLRKTGILICPEEVCAAGCIGSVLTAEAGMKGIPLKSVKLLNLGDGIVPHGSRDLLTRDFGIDVDSIVFQTIDSVKR